MNIPLGFRFSPTDEELIRSFLYSKVAGLRLPWDGVTSRRVYGENAEPWRVFSDADDEEWSYYWHTKKEGGSIKKTIYVFTTITKSAPNARDSKRAARIAGCGTWSGQTGPKDILFSDTGETIGYSRMLTYKVKKEKEKEIDQDSVGHWIMHEYSLSDSTLARARRTRNEIVLCKITRVTKKKEQDHHHLLHPQIQAQAQEQYYSPENTNTNTNTAADDHNSWENFDEEIDVDSLLKSMDNDNKRSRDSQEQQISWTSTSETNDDSYDDNNSNKRSRHGEEQVFEMQQQQQQQRVLEMQQQQQQEEEEEKSWSTTASSEINIYDLPYVEFGDIDTYICS